MNAIIEWSFPANCPDCGRASVEAAQPHCDAPKCPWLRCICGRVFGKVRDS